MEDVEKTGLDEPKDLKHADWTVIEADGFIGLVGPIWAAPEIPCYRFAFVAEDKHLNRSGVVHGGMLMTFADRAMGVSSRNSDPSIKSQSTISLTFDFMASAVPGDLVQIRCEVMRRTRSLSFMRGTLSSNGQVIGTANGIWKVRR